MWGWESLALGQALIARFHPDVLFAYEELSQGEEIPVYDANNIDDVAKYVRMLLNDRAELEDACLKSRAWMMKHYAPKVLVEKYISMYTH